MYALFEYKGKQYKAEKDALIQVDKIYAEDGAKITIDSVLLVSDGDAVKVGTPYVNGAKVEVEVENSFRDKKVLVYKYKAKKNERKTQGHRQPYTKIKIEKISQRASSKKAAATETEAAE